MFVLLFSPLSPPYTGSEINRDVYNWSALQFQGAELDEVVLLNLPLKQAGEAFSEEAIRSATASVVVLRTQNGQPAALGTRLSVADEGSDLLSAKLGVRTYSNVFWPNSGSILISGYENRWPVLRSAVMHSLGQVSDRQWLVSAKQPAGDFTGVAGGSGGSASRVWRRACANLMKRNSLSQSPSINHVSYLVALLKWLPSEHNVGLISFHAAPDATR